MLALDLGLAEEDACDVLAHLSARDFSERITSTVTGEVMYVFAPRVADVVLYVKVALRRHCVVISFHELENTEGDDAS